jgi:hypothetical protein
VPSKPADGPAAPETGTPTEVQGLIEFLNSRGTSKRPERFETPEHAQSFLAQCDLGYDGRPLSDVDTLRLVQLRDALVDAIENPANPEPWLVINELATTIPIQLQTTTGPAVTLRPARDSSGDAVIVAVLDRLSRAVTTGRWDRLGACARCRRVFYDNTRSHTRRWCSYATCGNRANVASYRERARST